MKPKNEFVNKKQLHRFSCFFVAFLIYATVGGNLYAQEKIVKGIITDQTGQSILGASIAIVGQSKGTVSDNDGNFSLKVNEDDVLHISFLGYVDQNIPIKGKSNFKIILMDNTQMLDEFVVVGYGSMKKSDVTGAMVNVGADEIKKMPVTNAIQAMQGKAAGVDITSNERPGEVGKILIRGSRSLNASNAPLYVVDGIPLSSGGIEALNPLDIESIDVLKDASATAIYGSRGANGVVLITTKKGKAGKLQLTYSGAFSVDKQYDRTEMMDAPEYIEYRRQAHRGAGNYPDVATEAADKAIFGQDPVAWSNVDKGWSTGTWDPNAVSTTPWGSMVTRTGTTQEHTVSASGGTDKIKSYASIGYLNQTGTLIGQDYKRYNVKISADIVPTSWFSMGASLTETWSTQNYGFLQGGSAGASNIYMAARGMLPFAQPYDANGDRIIYPGGDVNIINPTDEDQYCINQRNVLRTLGSIYAEVKIIEGLRFRMNFGPDFYHLRNGQFQDENSALRGGGGTGSTNWANLSNNQRMSWTLDNLIYYDKTFNKIHDVGITLLQSSSAFHQETSFMTASNLPWSSQKWNQMGSVDALDKFGTNLVETQMLSYMARGNYTYNGKYMVTASIRWDGASQLAEGHKWDYFPSMALGWRMDQEAFMKNIKWINQLKLRLGVGSTGNSSIAAYQTKGGLTTHYYTYGKTVMPGYIQSDPSDKSPAVMPDKNLGWEHTTQTNLGVDFGVLNNRISGTIDVYSSTTSDLLMQRSVPSVTGYTKVWTNMGKTKNKGVDLTLNTVNIESKNFTWTSNLNFTASKDRIVELANGKEDVLSNNWFIGQRLNVYYDYTKVGIWQNTPEDLAEMAKFNANGSKFTPGSIRVQDLNGDYKIDANNDKQIVGHPSPNWNAGFTNTFTYKNWDLSLFIYARWGSTFTGVVERLDGRYAQRELDYWTPTNPTNNYPAPNSSNAAGDPYISTMNYFDGSFIKLRNVSLGYHFSNAKLTQLGISNLKVYAQLRNPTMIYSKTKWTDADLGMSTFNRGLVFGLNVSF